MEEEDAQTHSTNPEIHLVDHQLLPSVCNPPPPFSACSHVGRVIDKGPSWPLAPVLQVIFSTAFIHSQLLALQQDKHMITVFVRHHSPPTPPSVSNVNEVLISTAIKLQTSVLPNQPVYDRAKMVFPANQMPIRFGKTLHGLTDNQSPLGV